MQDWCIGLSSQHLKSTRPHVRLNLLLSDMAPFNEGISWLRQNWLPFVDTPDEILAQMTGDWGGEGDNRFPADTSQLSSRCQELARSCDRHVSSWLNDQRLMFRWQWGPACEATRNSLHPSCYDAWQLHEKHNSWCHVIDRVPEVWRVRWAREIHQNRYTSPRIQSIS